MSGVNWHQNWRDRILQHRYTKTDDKRISSGWYTAHCNK